MEAEFKVHPCLINKDLKLSNVNGVLNAVIIEGKANW